MARDDSALGPKADYEKYLNTFNEADLDLQDKPDRYYLKGIDLVTSAFVADVMGLAKEEEQDRQARVESAVAQVELARSLVERCIVGFDCHPYVDGIGEDGQPAIKTLRWKLGEEPPKDHVKIVASDMRLMIDILMYLTFLSSLTDAEKESDPRV